MFGELNRKTVRWLYKHIIKPFFFKRDPGEVHDLFSYFGNKLGSSAFNKSIAKKLFSYSDPILHQELWGLHFANPVGLSEGFDKDAYFLPILPSVGFGYTQVGTVTAHPYGGNPKPMVVRLPEEKSLIVNYGLKNEGIPKIIERVKNYPPSPIPVSWSIGKTNSQLTCDVKEGLADYLNGFDMVVRANIADILTINVSCPNTWGGEPFTTPERLELLLAGISQKEFSQPIFIKLPINKPWQEFEPLIKICIEYGVDAVIIGNLNKDRSDIRSYINPEQKGSLSGKPTWELSNNLIKQTYKNYGDQIKIVGVGGIFSAEDAYTKIRLGATLVQLITGMIYEGPQLIGEINHGIGQQLKRDGFKNISEAIGIDAV